MRSVPPEYTVGPPAPAVGFRACKRCLPDQETPSTGLVRKVCKHIQEQSDESGSVPTLAELRRAIGSSPTHLQRVFKEATGVTPRQYASAWRLDRFKATARTSQRPSMKQGLAHPAGCMRPQKNRWA